MMLAKLVFKNIKQSAKDYLIYIVTMTVCVTMFYAFLSISSSYYHPNIGTTYNINLLGNSMKLSICAITVLILFLIRYVNNYMLKCKQKEFAIQSVIGMEQKTISLLFFAETFLMGIISIVIGIFLGVFCSQFITAILLTSYGQEYTITWTLFPDIVVLTVAFFTISLIVVGLFNIRTIRKIKVIDMLYADKQNDQSLSKSNFLPTISIVYFIISVFALFKGLEVKHLYFDNRYPLVVHILFNGNIIVPILVILISIIFILHKKRNFSKFIVLETIFSLFNMILAASIPLVKNTYHLAYGNDVMNQYIILALAHAIYLICGIIFLINYSIIIYKDKSINFKYKEENLFLLGQIISKLSTNTKTMSLITITLVFSICLFMISPVLTNWIDGFLNIRSVYDIQISSAYNLVVDKNDLPDTDYDIVTKFMEDKNIKQIHDRTFSLYLPKEDDFYKRKTWEFPVEVISLSDYNSIREMLGYDKITLKKNEFTTHWYAMSTDEDREKFSKENSEIISDGGKLSLAKDSYHLESIGENIYNLYTDFLLVFPDDICKNLLPVNRNRFIMTEEQLSFSDAKELENLFYKYYKETPEGNEGTSYSISTSTLDSNTSLAASFVLKASLNYGAIILMVICLTMLSLQQLLDANKYKYRFSVLRKIGVEEKNIKKLILKQLGVWFGIPIIVALVLSIIIVTAFIKSVSSEITAYIGFNVLFQQLGFTILVLIILLTCYFISTWILFNRNIE